MVGLVFIYGYNIVSAILRGMGDSKHDFVWMKHSRDFEKFKKEMLPDGRVVYTYDNGSVTYSYEFTEL